MTIENQNHHYVPQFLLRKFAFDSRNFCNAFDIEQNKWLKPKHVRKLAAELNFYSLDHLPDENKHILEVTLSKNERDTSLVLQKIWSSQAISAEEESNLAIFIALMNLRTPKSLKRIELMLKVSHKQRIDLHINNLRRNSNDPSKIPVALHPLIENKTYVEKILPYEKAEDLNISIKRPGVLQFLTSDVVLETANLFLQGRTWTFLQNQTQFPFVTTDNPVTIFNPNYKPIPGHGHGILSSNKAEVYFPLSPKICLCISHGKRESIYQELSSEDRVREINKRVIENADKTIISRDKFDLDSNSYQFRETKVSERLGDKQSSFMIYE